MIKYNVYFRTGDNTYAVDTFVGETLNHWASDRTFNVLEYGNIIAMYSYTNFIRLLIEDAE